MPIKLSFVFFFDDQWESCSLKLYGCPLLSSHSLFTTPKNRWFQRFQHHACPRLLKTPMQTAISFAEPWEFPKIYSGRFKWVYLWRVWTRLWVSEKTSVTNKPSLSFFFSKKESPYLPRLWTHAFPIMCWNGSYRRLCDCGETETESTAIEKIKLNLTSRLMDKWWLERGYAYLNCILSLLQS